MEYIDIWTFYDQIPRTSRTALVMILMLNIYILSSTFYITIYTKFCENHYISKHSVYFWIMSMNFLNTLYIGYDVSWSQVLFFDRNIF